MPRNDYFLGMCSVKVDAKSIFFASLTYFYLFQPPIISKYIYVAVLLSFSAFVIGKYGFLVVHRFKNELSVSFFIIFFPLVRDLFSGEIVYSDRFVYWFLQSFIFSYCLVIFSLKNDISIISSLFLAALMAAFVTTFSFFNEGLDRFLVSIQDDPIYEYYSSFEFRYRAYGFSEHLTATYSVVMGFFAGVSLFLIERRFYYIFVVALFLFASGVNARLGGIVFLIFLFFYLVDLVFTRKNIIEFALVFSFLVLLYFLYFYIFEASGIVGSWYFGVFNEVKDFFDGGSGSGVLGIIFGEFIIIPSKVSHLLFGSGESLYLNTRLGRNSDVGFILQLNYIGILYTAFLYVFMLGCFLRLIGICGLGHWFPWVFLLGFFVVNTKGFFFAGVPGARLFFILYVSMVVSASIEEEKLDV